MSIEAKINCLLANYHHELQMPCQNVSIRE